MNKQIEKDIYFYLNNAFSKINKLNDKYSFEIAFNDNANDANYFSEIEIEMWKNSSIIYIYSIIIFIKGKQQGTKEELLKEFLFDLFECSELEPVK